MAGCGGLAAWGLVLGARGSGCGSPEQPAYLSQQPLEQHRLEEKQVVAALAQIMPLRRPAHENDGRAQQPGVGLRWRDSATPSMLGIMQSEMIRSGTRCATTITASKPLLALMTSNPCSAKYSA